MKLNMIDKIISFFNWFVDFLGKPLGIATWSIVLILAGVYYGDYQRDKANLANKEQTTLDGNRIKQLENKIDNMDCSGEVQKYINLIEIIKSQTSQNKEYIDKSLETARKKTQELENFDKSLNTK